MGALARVGFEMGPRDANNLFPAVYLNGDATLSYDRLVVLANLVTHGQIGIEVVFAVELTEALRFRAQSKSGTRGKVQGFFVQYRQRAGQAEIDVIDQRV